MIVILVVVISMVIFTVSTIINVEVHCNVKREHKSVLATSTFLFSLNSQAQVPDRASEKLLLRSVLRLNWLDAGRLKSDEEFGVIEEVGVTGTLGVVGVESVLGVTASTITISWWP